MRTHWFPINRVVAAFNWLFAIVVGVPCALTLYAIRKGQFHNYWIEPNAFGHIQERGLLLCLFCLLVGFGLWSLKRWSQWCEVLLFPLKVYCAYLFTFGYAMSGSWLYLIVPVVVTLDFGLVILLCSHKLQTWIG